jgi:hypothetical protein
MSVFRLLMADSHSKQGFLMHGLRAFRSSHVIPIGWFALACPMLAYIVAPLPAQDSKIVEPYREAALERWEKDIQALEALDKEETDPEDAILFIGSSSIRRWKTIQEDMKPWPVIRRGYGGAKFSDLAVFVDRLVSPHDVRAIAVFVANDISGKEKDKSPEEVRDLYDYVVKRIKKIHPQAHVFCIAITPTSSRFKAWPEIQRLNKLLEMYSQQDEHLHFISTEKEYLGGDGKPMDELFVGDLLHLNDKGYGVWAEIIKSHLTKVLGTSQPD